ncbi:MAG TPA: J domain-containing protein [Caulobacteraceae bacterium]|jgi:DnaJ-class molecular chaperone
MAQQDLYQELGVSRSASAEEVRRAFRKLAKELHPDKNPGDKKAEERFKKVSAAFDILGDPDKRKKYDRGQIDANGHETMGPGFDPFSRGGGGGTRRQGPWDRAEEMQFEGVDLNDILGEMFGGGGGRPGRGGGRRGGFGGGFEARGADVRATLRIDLEDAIAGGTKRIAFSDGRTLDVAIPKGAREGQVLRLKGQGAPGRAGPGDALIEIEVAQHPVYRREDDKLVMDLPVTVYDAVLGGKVEAPTPDGPVTLTVPKGANTGTTLRLKGRGLPDPQTGRRGDLLARLAVTLPDGSDGALESFCESWRRERPYRPRRRGG